MHGCTYMYNYVNVGEPVTVVFHDNSRMFPVLFIVHVAAFKPHVKHQCVLYGCPYGTCGIHPIKLAQPHHSWWSISHIY